MISLYSQHVKKWKDCDLCDLHHVRNKVVIARGTVPCDILFVGEAPGDSEDAIGRPFIGPAGKIMDTIISKSVRKQTYALTNLVCCVPKNDGNKISQPYADEIASCADRLSEFVEICNPKLVVCVGALAKDFFPVSVSWYMGTIIDILHPGNILRANVAQKGLAIQMQAVKIANAIVDIWG